MRWMLAALALATAPAFAANLDWPGPAPCNTSLQACIDAAAAGDRIRVGSEGPIDEHLSITRSLRLEALPGWRPRMPAGRRITASASGGAAFDLRLRGFQLGRGSVAVAHSGSGSLNLSLQDLEIVAEAGREGLRIDAAGGGPVGITIENVAIAIDGASGGDARPALRIVHSGAGLLDGVIGFVQIDARGLGNAAALAVDGGPGGADLDVFGVRVDGAATVGGIAVRAGSGPLTLNLVSNAVVGDGDGSDVPTLAAIRVDAVAANATVNVLNNTTIGTPRGLVLAASTGTLTGAVQNNVVVQHAVRGVDLPQNFANRNNLVWGNTADLWTAGPGTLAVDPQLVDPAQPRLRSDSPAIGAGDRVLLDAVAAARALPALDVDGLRRFKGAQAALDLGAFEHGDTVVSHTIGPANISNGLTWFTHPQLDGQPQQAPQAIARRTAAGSVPGPLGLLYSDSIPPVTEPQRWALQNQDGSGLPAGAAIDVFVPTLGGPGALIAGPLPGLGSGALLDVPGLNGNPRAVVWAIHRMIGAGLPFTSNPHPIAVGFDDAAQRWRVDNADNAMLPMFVALDVYWQDESSNAFAHEAAAPNLSGAATVLSHPLLDGNPCARPFVQTVRAEGLANPHPVGTVFDAASARWRIENRDGAPMAGGATFYVLVIAAQAQSCASELFIHSFE